MPKKPLMLPMCCDRILVGTQKVKAMQAALAENAANGVPPAPRARKRMGASSMLAPAKMALEAGKKWSNGRTLRVYFMDGSARQRAQTQKYAQMWYPYCSIRFDFTASRANSDLRISFVADSGAWSYIGTDNLVIPKTQPTMNYGWLRDNTPEDEWRRVVLHEFGHALGAIHEHQNPKGGIQWNTAAVYAYFGGPPNNWSKEEIDTNVLDKYSVDQLNASSFDKDSIMLYQFDGALLKSGKPTPFNTQLSVGDKRFIRKQYPSA